MMLLFLTLVVSIYSQECVLPGRWIGFNYDTSRSTWTETAAYEVISTKEGFMVMPATPVQWNSATGICSDHVILTADFPEQSWTGKLSDSGRRVTWADGSYWVQEQVHTVHVVFMNHLDVGYNGIGPVGFINNVLNVYFHNHLPRVWRLQEALLAGGYTERFLYTTHPWLVSFYLDCPDLTLAGVRLICPSSEDREHFIAAVTRGDISWHAGPFNLQPENMDASLFEWGLTMATDLDKRFNITRKFGVLSQRDVPGMTRSVIPLLVKNNVLGITVGQNGATPPVGVPKIFRWRDPDSMKEIITMDHPYGYGGIDLVDDVVTANGNALAYAFRTDNSGPPTSIQEILAVYSSLRGSFPGAKVIASTYEAFVEAIMPVSQTFPLIEKEIGDVWIDGISSDPLKETLFREASRARTSCLESKKCDPNDPRIKDFNRYLIKVPEHTWGLPGVYDNANWSNDLFQKARHTGNYQNCEAAWREQREFVNLAIKALKDHPLAAEIQGRIKALSPQIPSTKGLTNVPLNSKLTCHAVSFQFDGNGALSLFNDGKTDWVDSKHTFGGLTYRTFTESDFDYMMKYYGGNAGYQKYNSSCAQSGCANPIDFLWLPKATQLFWNATTCSGVLSLQFPTSASVKYGAPAEAFYAFQVTSTAAETSMDMNLVLWKKTSTRLPEQMMVEFVPKNNLNWKMDKLGSWVSPIDVQLNGSQYQHAVWSGFTGEDKNSALVLTTYDAPLVCPITSEALFPGWSGTPTTMPVPTRPFPNASLTGMAVNLFNNVWDTNYILWYPYDEESPDDENLFFRFNLKTRSVS